MSILQEKQDLPEDAAVLARRVFRENVFVNVDIGPLNDALDVDCFVISIPKSGTTALQRGLERQGRRVIHAHNNETTYEAFSNGSILRANGLGLGTVLKARLLAKSQPLHLFFGYREPVSWYLSMAGHFSLPLDASLCDNIVENVETRHPWTAYRIDDTASIVREATGMDVLQRDFDHDLGYSLVKKDGVNLICYRFDRLERVRDYIVENVDEGFALTRERVNDDPAYIAYKTSFSPPKDALERLYDDRWFQHFYTPTERDALIHAYVRKA